MLSRYSIPQNSTEQCIFDLPTTERPRERLFRLGAEQLKDQELVAIMLGSGGPGRPVMELARELMERPWNLGSIRQVQGLGKAKSAAFLAGLELGKRQARRRGPRLDGPERVYELLAEGVEHKREHFWGLYLSARRRLIHQEVISVGTLTASLVHPREVFKPALEHGAAALLVAHNHPSGDPEPSSEDISLTRRLARAGQVLGIELVDHVIIATDGFCSLRERGDFP